MSEMKCVAWVTKDYDFLKMNEIKDSHLLNILRFLEKGRAYNCYLDKRMILNLFKEADERNLTHNYDLLKALDIFEIIRERNERCRTLF